MAYPEQSAVDVVYERCVAWLIDFVARLVVMFAVAGGFVGLLLVTLSPEAALAPGLGEILGFTAAIAGIVGYGAVLETYWNGQTVGKRLMGIRVVDETGGPIDLQQGILRNLPGLFWFSAGSVVVGLSAMMASGMRQRVFDRVAGTYVVDVDEHDVSDPEEDSDYERDVDVWDTSRF